MFLLSELIDWMCEKTGRDPHHFHYKRTELMLSPVIWAKTLVIERLPIGQHYVFKPNTVERLERVRLIRLS